MKAEEAVKMARVCYNMCKVEGCPEKCIYHSKVVIDALEKQVPQKPIFKKSDETEKCDTFQCPICDGTVGIFDLQDKYCCDCGQAIDWNEKDV